MKFENGKIIFETHDLREMRERLIEPENVKKYNIQCQGCRSVIVFTQALTSNVTLPNGTLIPKFDEDGVVTFECTKCQKLSRIKVVNPDVCYAYEGAEKVEYAFLEGMPEPLNLEIGEIATCDDYLAQDIGLHELDHNYSPTGEPLYTCHKCGAGLDEKAYEILIGQINNISNGFDRYLNWYLANGGGPRPEYQIVRLPCKCECGLDTVSYFSKPYSESANIKETDFALINIVGAKNLQGHLTPGSFSKTQIMQWLRKLQHRWAILFDDIYLITPFIGHQYLKSEQRVENWLNVVRKISPEKTKIVTRSSEVKLFEKAYSSISGIDYNKLQELGLSSQAIDGTIKKNKFHIKLYCAISKFGFEALSGSANIVEGPSIESMIFMSGADSHEFNEKFLKPLGLNCDLSHKHESKDHRYSLLLRESENFNPLYAPTLHAHHYRALILQDSQPVDNW
ncbi:MULTISPECIES: hypothetical protein [Pseudomonas]|uniref:hypothetical protein n=1 Tax=Pseudomonas TaxID=286 RepID=UPI00257D952B|nr:MULTISPECIES: hypothetical protein [Pseudomonas]